MVCRLVEDQDVGLWRKHTGERHPAPLAAGQPRRLLVAGEAQSYRGESSPDADRRPRASPAST